jgi:hypothetical protein
VQWLTKTGPIVVLNVARVLFSRDGQVWSVDMDDVRAEHGPHDVSADCIISEAAWHLQPYLDSPHATFDVATRSRDHLAANSFLHRSYDRVFCLDLRVLMPYTISGVGYTFIAATSPSGWIDTRTVTQLNYVTVFKEQRMIRANLPHGHPAHLPPGFVSVCAALPGPLWRAQWIMQHRQFESPFEPSGRVIRLREGALRMTCPGSDREVDRVIKTMVAPLIPLMREQQLVISIHTASLITFTLWRDTVEESGEPRQKDLRDIH